jgi:hypothetical protein
MTPVAPGPPNPDMLRQRSTIIEILDLAAGRVVATHRFDGQQVHLLSSEFAYSIREGPLGAAVVDLWRITLR